MADELDSEQLFGRVVAVATGEERTILEAFLEFYRDAIVRKTSGLSDDDARRRLVGSHTTLAGLLKHLQVVELNWFQRILARAPEDQLPAIDWSDEDSTFQLDPADTLDGLQAAYHRQCQLSREVAARHQLTDTVPHPDLGQVNLRWIYVHMIHEIAHHTGHADILREQTDGQTGP